jgi:two-component system, OmpR family, KDP operon response regulator KdpE
MPRAHATQAAAWPPRGPARVLIVLQDGIATRVATLILNHGVYDTHVVSGAAEARTQAASWKPHLALVDMDLEGGSLVGQLSAIAGGHWRLPVIGLTRRGDLRAKLAAFDAGADDILTFPFAPEELLARVAAVVRRSYSDAVTFTPKIKLGELEIDILNRTVYNGTSEVHLTSLEQSLLYLLAANAGRIVTREEILDTLWGADYVSESNVVDRQIRNLRVRLQDDWRRPRFVATVRGRGYRFLLSLPPQPGS